MKILALTTLVVCFILFGCARTWMYQPIESFKPSETVPPASICQPCHPLQYGTWKDTRHSEDKSMSKIAVPELHECGACHNDLASHAADPTDKLPNSISKMTRSDKNTLCGKCHYNQQIFGNAAINPHDKHALLTSVALEGQKKQIACLDCHSGHKGGADMLLRIKAHICYECHTSAIFTMGIFQPFNYITFGKMCQACHTVHGGSSGARWGRMSVGFCVICHFAGVALVN